MTAQNFKANMLYTQKITKKTTKEQKLEKMAISAALPLEADCPASHFSDLITKPAT